MTAVCTFEEGKVTRRGRSGRQTLTFSEISRVVTVEGALGMRPDEGKVDGVPLEFSQSRHGDKTLFLCYFGLRATRAHHLAIAAHRGEDPERMADADVSPMFKLQGSRYGNVAVVVTLADALTRFAEQSGTARDKLEFRVFGTAQYAAECCYMVLVCLHGQLDGAKYPLLSDDPDAYIRVTSTFEVEFDLLSCASTGTLVQPDTRI